MNLAEYLQTLYTKKVDGVHTFDTLSLQEQIVNLTADAVQYQVKGLTNPADSPFKFVDVLVLPAQTKIFANGTVTTTQDELPLVLNPTTSSRLRFEYPAGCDDVVTAYTLCMDKKKELIYQPSITCGDKLVVSAGEVFLDGVRV